MRDIPPINQLFDPSRNKHIPLLIHPPLIPCSKPPLICKTLFIRLIIIQIPPRNIFPTNTNFPILPLFHFSPVVIQDRHLHISQQETREGKRERTSTPWPFPTELGFRGAGGRELEVI